MKEQPTVLCGDNRWEAVVGMGLLFFAAATLFAVNIGNYALWPGDEPRFGQVSREMMQSGDFISPTLNGESYLEKPPLLFWAIAAVSYLPGNVTEWSARIPSVLSALATLALSYLLAMRLFGHRVALWSVIVLVTNLGFWWQARTVQTDMLLTMWMTAALYGLWRWDESRKGKWLLLLWGAVAAGLLTQGPPALVFPLLFIFAFYWKQPASRKQTHWVIGTLAALSVAAIWYVPAQLAVAAGFTGEAASYGFAENLFHNTIGRFILGVGNAQPPWFYLEVLLFDWFPWVLFFPWVLVFAWRNRAANRMMWFLMCWMGPALLFFSIAIDKEASYILPLFPAMAIVIASGLVYFDQTATLRWRNRVAAVWGFLMVVLGGALSIYSAVALALSGQPVFFEEPAFVLAMGGGLLLLGAYAVERGWRQRAQLIHRIVAGQMAILLFMSALILLPEMDVYKSAKGITAPIRLLVESGKEMNVYSVGFSREEYVFYARHFHEPIVLGPLGIEKFYFEDRGPLAKQQRKARKKMRAAVEAVPIANMEYITVEERQTLQDAIENAWNIEENAAELQIIEDEVINDLHAFATRFFGPAPAFMFVQDADWRWLYPLFAVPFAYHVIRQECVGGRQVMLLANAAGYALYEKRTGGAGLLS